MISFFNTPRGTVTTQQSAMMSTLSPQCTTTPRVPSAPASVTPVTAWSYQTVKFFAKESMNCPFPPETTTWFPVKSNSSS